ncbi:MAG: hypothetical protein WBM04_07035 [Candidatus Korobacteraceae bacterium]
MSIWAQVKISVVAITVFVAMPVVAQRYQEHDHHVFHPPAPAKRQGVPSTGSTMQTRMSSAGNASTTRGHDSNLNASHNDPSHTPISSNPYPVHPH